MEKRCEFCKALRAAVYCKSDAAYLCLSCDAKVHSANALSLRHPRTLVCDSCRFHPSIVRCFEHDMFMCDSCDTNHHVSLQHRRNVVSSYVGCPSAKDLAHLWGFHVNQSEGRTSTPKPKVVNDERSRYLIVVQQILELEKVQLSDSCSVNVEEESGGSAFRHEMLDNPVDGGKTEEVLLSPFPQLDNLTSGGDSFWQYNEIWHQNMQDLGVCDEVQCFDDVEIPDVDLTFRNFEEVFGSDQEDEKTYNLQPPSLGRLDTSTSTSTVEETNNDVDQSQSRAASSFSCSRITGQSSCSDGKESAIARYKEKRVLRQEKQGHYTYPRSKSEFKKRERVK